MTRARLRDLGIAIGALPTGPHNAITDVPGVLVGQTTLVYDTPRVARTGVTVIVPRGGTIWEDRVFGGFFSFNGCGEMTGLPWLEESGMLDSAIGITNTHGVGLARDAIVAHAVRHGQIGGFLLPVAAETYDGWLSDIDAFHITQEHVIQALDAARAGPVDEGNVGGGTGMICHGFKGGIGTSSRVAETTCGSYTVGALVQANYGARRDLRVDGVPVGREIGPDRVPVRVEPPAEPPSGAGSIIVVIATDAPLLPVQCKRLARRAATGLARAGGVGYNGSGDIFLAFATGNHLPQGEGLLDLKMLPHDQIDPLFVATADAVEEAILNALCAAETMTGYRGRTVHALPLDELQRVMARYRPSPA
ncbi:MAG: P1 family peptidase [Kouleothrix sp.]|nr:P1 family peptidase [Kouleothrix sp.]